MYVHIYINIYICLGLCKCVCICVYMCINKNRNNVISCLGHFYDTGNLQLRRYKIYNFNTAYLMRKLVKRYAVELKYSHGCSALKICLYIIFVQNMLLQVIYRTFVIRISKFVPENIKCSNICFSTLIGSYS